MRIVQLILSLCVLAVLLFNLYMQRRMSAEVYQRFWQLGTWNTELVSKVAALQQRLDALEQDDCSQVPVEGEMRSKL